jgi:hypothetical protein
LDWQDRRGRSAPARIPRPQTKTLETQGSEKRSTRVWPPRLSASM